MARVHDKDAVHRVGLERLAQIVEAEPVALCCGRGRIDEHPREQVALSGTVQRKPNAACRDVARAFTWHADVAVDRRRAASRDRRPWGDRGLYSLDCKVPSLVGGYHNSRHRKRW